MTSKIAAYLAAYGTACPLCGGTLPRHTPDDELRDRVFKHVYGRLTAGETVNLNNAGWGPAVISGDIGCTEAEVKRCLNELTARSWLVKAVGGYQLGPQAQRPGV